MDYKAEILKYISEEELTNWLKINPKPKKWKGDNYTWAYVNIPVGKLTCWFKQRIINDNKNK